MPLHPSRLSLALLLTLAACGDPGDADGTADAGVALDAGDAGADDDAGDAGDQPNTRDPFDPGPWTPAHVTTTLTDADREGRTFAVEIWYPSDAPLPEPAASVATFADGAEANALQALLDAAPAECPTRVTGAARGAAPIASPRPVVAMSHCFNCGRFSTFSVAERLASHGFVVVAPDHAGSLPFGEGAAGETLDTAQLEVRAADMTAALDAAIRGDLFEGTAASALRVDGDAVGVMGHSFGSVTAGFVAQGDARVAAAVGLAAPMANPLLPGVDMAAIDAPVLLLLAEEDNSILEIGNTFLRTNFEDANPPAWRVDVADAGHWSVSDLAGLVPAFAAGCGEGTRHSEGRSGEPFTYLPVAEGIEITAEYVSAFFLAHLTDHPTAQDTLASPPARAGVTVLQR